MPATSANLGPGFDVFGLALGLYDEVRITVAGPGLRVRVTGEGEGELPLDERHLVLRSFRTACALLGAEPAGLEISCRNEIPQARGLGSSAAAIVAGILAARSLYAHPADSLDDDAVLGLAAQLEGHPDNVAACLHGGLTIAWTTAGATRVLPLEPARDLVPVVFVPAQQSSTAQARAALPTTVPLAAAVANACRAALLVPALTGRPELLLEATRDWLHQDARAASMPQSAALMATLRADGIPAVISGAGPSVLAFSAADLQEYAGGWRLLQPAVAGPATVDTPPGTRRSAAGNTP